MASIKQRSPGKSGADDGGPENNGHSVSKHPRHNLHSLAATRGKVHKWTLLWKILEPFSQVLHSAGSPRPIVHFDNTALHRSAVTGNCVQHCRFRRDPQPLYSLDISPCDFFLFADLKTKLKGEELENVEELHGRVNDLLAQVTSETMRRVRGHWIGRLNIVTHTGGESASNQLSWY
jgi:hypothetical protein